MVFYARHFRKVENPWLRQINEKENLKSYIILNPFMPRKKMASLR